MINKEQVDKADQAFQNALLKSIMANQLALNCNEILKHSKFYKGNIKKYGKPYNLALIQAEAKEFDKIDEVDENRVDELFEITEKLLHTLSRAVNADWKELNDVIKAYAKSPESVLGISKKVLR
jgi:hypothetical protein